MTSNNLHSEKNSNEAEDDPYMDYLKRKQEKKKDISLDFQDYVALTIAMLQTILVPILIIMGVLFVIVVLLGLVGGGDGSVVYHLIEPHRGYCSLFDQAYQSILASRDKCFC